MVFHIIIELLVINDIKQTYLPTKVLLFLLCIY